MSYQLSRLDLVTNAGSTTISVGTTPTGQTYVTGDIPSSDNIIKVSRSDDIKTSPILTATVQSTSSAQNLSGVTLNLPEGGTTLQSNTDLLGQNYTYNGDINTQLLVGHGVDSSSTSIADLSSNNYNIVYGGTGTSSAAGSLSFNGSTQYLTVPANAAFSFGTGDFTVETWIYTTNPANTNGKVIVDSRPDATNGAYWIFALSTSGQLQATTMTTGGVTLTSPSAVPFSQWVHVAYTRGSGTLNLWVDGVSVASASGNSDNISSNILKIGTNAFRATATDTYFNGYISNARIVKGTAQYTSNFIPTVPLTNVTNTKLLLLAASDANKLVDSSSSPVTITNNNSVTFSTNVPSTGSSAAVPAGTSPYTTSQFNCFKFDGNAFLNVPDNAVYYIVPTTTSITFEAWFYPTSHPATAYFASQTSVTSTYPWAMYFVNGKPTWSACAVAGTVVFTASSTTTLSLNTWTHVAWVYEASANRFVVYINGVREVLATNAVAMFNSTDSLRIGANTTTAGAGINFYSGYIGDIRSTNSATTYSANFTTPTGNILASYPIANPYGGSNTAAMTGTAAGGNYCNLLISTVGGANSLVFDSGPLNQTVTSTNVFPAYVTNSSRAVATTYNSASFNYSINWSVGSTGTQAIQYAHHTGLDLSTGAPNWCVEGWIYWSGQVPIGVYAGQNNVIFEKDAGLYYVGASYSIYIAPTGILKGYIGNTITGQVIGLAAMPANIWTHVAFCRKSTVITLYINGVTSESATVVQTMADNSYIATLGGLNSTPYQNGGFFQGYISNFRVIKGNNVYSGTSTTTPNFCLPTQAFTASQIGYGRNGVAGTQTGFLLGFVGTNSTICDLSVWANPAVTSGASTFPTAITTLPPNLSLPSSTYNYNSVYLNGSGYLNFLTGKPFQLGQEEFTVEFWFYQDALASAVLVDNYPTSAFKGVWQIWSSTATGVLQFLSYDSTATASSITSAVNAYAAKSWVHVALVRRKTFAIGINQFTITLYVNGVSVGTVINTSYLGVDTLASTPTLARGANIGRQTSDGTLPFTGYISDLRIIKQAIYNANFAPPTTQLTTTVQLPTPTPQFGALSFDGVSQYIGVPATAGSALDLAGFTNGSILFNGNNYLTVDNTTLQFGTSPFTIEGWIYRTTSSALVYIASKQPTNLSSGWNLCSGFTNGYINFTAEGGSVNITGTTTVSINTWYHFAFVREGTGTNQTKIYLNGQLDATGTCSTNFTQTDLFRIGAGGSTGNYFAGNINNFRVVKGIAVYTGNFTLPTTIFASTQAVNPFGGSNTAGISGSQTILLLNTPNTSNGYLIDNSSYANTVTGAISTPALSSLAPSAISASNTTGTLNWTIECWLYLNDTASTYVVFNKDGTSGTQNPSISLNISSGAQQLILGNGGTGGPVASSSQTILAKRWTHIAAVRNGSSLNLYVNGITGTTQTAITMFNSNTPFYIGVAYDPTARLMLPGYIANFRIVKGTALYTGTSTTTANFTLPPLGTPLSNVTNTVLLLNVTSDTNKLLDSSGSNLVVTGSTTYAPIYDSNNLNITSSPINIINTGNVIYTKASTASSTTSANYEPVTIKSEYTLNYTPSLSTTRMYDTGVTGSVTINSYNTVNDSSLQILSANINIPVKNGVEFFINGTDAVNTAPTDPNYRDVRIRPVTNLTDPRRVDAKRPLFNQSGITGETVIDQQSWIN